MEMALKPNVLDDISKEVFQTPTNLLIDGMLTYCSIG
jgi:hypothetical protein